MNVVVTNMHLLADKVQLWGALQPSRFSFNETESVSNAFSATLMSDQHCPREMYNMGKTVTKTLTRTHRCRLRRHDRQAFSHHMYSVSNTGNKGIVSR